MSTLSLEDLPPGPILVVADNDAIGRSALAWAKAFQAAGRSYRVRLARPSTFEAMVTEANSLGAVAIVMAGSAKTRSFAHAAASRLGIPCVNDETVIHACES